LDPRRKLPAIYPDVTLLGLSSGNFADVLPLCNNCDLQGRWACAARKFEPHRADDGPLPEACRCRLRRRASHHRVD
jgi:hypothetical protein